MNLDFDFYTLFVAGLQSAEVFVAVFGILSAAAIAITMVSKIGTWVLPQPRESRVADFLPFDRLLSDGTTLLTTPLTREPDGKITSESIV